LIAAVIGFVWGLAGYAVLWGHTAIVVHRSFVVSPVGTILLAPVRLVLWGIQAVERAAGGPFDFSGNNWWIGAVSALAGAAMAAVVALGVRGVVRAVRGSGRKRVPESPESL
jgi:hypothetical protein